MSKQNLKKLKKIENYVLDTTAMVFVLEKALSNQDQRILDTLPYADMTKIISKKLHKIMDILFS